MLPLLVAERPKVDIEKPFQLHSEFQPAGDQPQAIDELCEGLAMTRQAVTKHLAVLEDANLVSTLRHGREKLHYLNPVPIHQIGERWIKKFERAKLVALGELKRRLEADEA